MKNIFMKFAREIFVDIEKYLAFVGCPFAICLGIFAVTVLQKIFIAVPLFLVGITCLIYLVMRPEFPTIDVDLNNSKRKTNFLLLQSLIFLSFAICAILLHSFSENQIRNPIFFVLVSIISVLLFWSIFNKNSNSFSTAIILTQIIILGLILTWSQIFNFQSIIGEDPYYHAQIVENILLFGKIPANTEYSFIPVFHLIIAQFCQISEATYRLSATLSVGLFQIISNTLFIFLLGRKALNEKIGMLGALLLILSSRHIRMGYEIVPTTLAATYIPIILYLAFYDKTRYKSTISTLIMLFTFIMILTHSLTSVWLIIVLLTLVLSYTVYNLFGARMSPPPISIKICSFSIIGLLGWWSFVSGHINILGGYLNVGFQSTILLKEVKESVWLNSSVGEIIINNLGMYLFFALSVIGCFYMISRWGNWHTYCFAGTGMVTVLITISGPFLQKFIIVGRWEYFSFILLAIPLALSLVLLHRVLEKKTIFAGCFISCLVFILAFIMIVCPTANNDNPDFSPTTHIRYGHSDSEIRALETMSRVNDNFIYTDTYLSLLSDGTGDVKIADKMIYTRNFHNLGNTPILIRDQILHRPVDIFRNAFFLGYDPRNLLNNQGYSQTYNDGGVFTYQFI